MQQASGSFSELMANTWLLPAAGLKLFFLLLGPKLIKINYISGHVVTHQMEDRVIV